MALLMVMNWKMHPETLAQAKTLLTATRKYIPGVIVAVPHIFLTDLARRTRAGALAAQDGHWEKTGPHTGCVSMAQIRATRTQYVIVGHAERRMAGDTDEDVGRKVLSALSLGLKVVACVGEQSRDEQGEYLLYIQKQITNIIADVPKSQRAHITIAYEPIWAIGAEHPMEAHDMHQMVLFIRKILFESIGPSGRSIPILYGGALTAETLADMAQNGEVDGFLVGRASLDTAQLKEMGATLKAL